MQLEWEVWIDLWHFMPETWTELGELMQEETHNSYHMSKGGWKHSTPRFPEVVYFPKCNNADIDWYVRMPTDPSLVGPKIETMTAVYEEEGGTLDPAFPMIDSWLLH